MSDDSWLSEDELWIVLQGMPRFTQVGDTKIAGTPDRDLAVIKDYAGMLPCFFTEEGARLFASKLNPKPGILKVKRSTNPF